MSAVSSGAAVAHRPDGYRRRGLSKKTRRLRSPSASTGTAARNFPRPPPPHVASTKSPPRTGDPTQRAVSRSAREITAPVPGCSDATPSPVLLINNRSPIPLDFPAPAFTSAKESYCTLAASPGKHALQVCPCASLQPMQNKRIWLHESRAPQKRLFGSFGHHTTNTPRRGIHRAADRKACS